MKFARIAPGWFSCAALLLAWASLATPSFVRACAVCIDGSANDPVADAFNWSVLFLMASPYAIFGTIGGFIFYQQRRRQAGPGAKPKRKTRWIWKRRESAR